MKFVDEFRNPDIARRIVNGIHQGSKQPIRIMEVCGTHTVAIFKHGIRELLPNTITLLSGPGCPVCVTSIIDLDKAIMLAGYNDVILVTFGDMMRVPGTFSSLEQEKANGRDIRVVYSCLDALEIAVKNPKKRVVFFGVGFETTSPSIASSIIEAKQRRIENFCVFSVHKLIPSALAALLSGGEVKVGGFILPGHVSTIIGSYPYEFIANDYHIPCVIAGFEPLDVLQSIYILVKQIEEASPKVEIQYRRSVRPEGNQQAMMLLYQVFEVSSSSWRGLGEIPNTGLRIREEYSQFDASRIFSLDIKPIQEDRGCVCGNILKGLISPYDCGLFAKHCTPQNPIGPCMVSSEGTCAAYYKYGRKFS